MTEYKAVETYSDEDLEIKISLDKIKMQYMDVIKYTTKYGNKIDDIEIFKYNDEIDLSYIHHIIQDIITRYNYNTSDMTMIIKEDVLEKLYNDMPKFSKEYIDSYEDLKSVYNVTLIPFDYMKEKCIIVCEEDKYLKQELYKDMRGRI